MPIHAKKNQFRGINAHLNSFIQNKSGEWISFHSAHVVQIAHALDEYLPEGYFARVEKSLQISQEGLPEFVITGRPIPDVTVLGDTSVGMSSSAATAALTTPIAATFDFIHEEEFVPAVEIRAVGDDDPAGTVVARLELLSPTNKPGGNDYAIYRDKRKDALLSGVPLIEIDYLHQKPPVIFNIGNYTKHEPDTAPYYIVVSDPRPKFEEGLSHIYLFHVDDPLPTVVIPLLDDDKITFDFNIPYNQTFERTRYYHAVVDYEQLPPKFETYGPDDQERIQQRMKIISEAYQKGSDLDTTIPEN